jgi:hypothetical protein
MPGHEWAAVAALIAGIVAFFTVVGFWMNLSDRITKADGKAESALQEAAEAKNEYGDLSEKIDEMNRDIDERIERARRDDGEGLAAIRQHVTELAMFMRDNFVRNAEFTAAMTKIEAGQLRLETKLDRVSEQMRTHT